MDDKHFVPGSFYRICDMTGFKVRAGRTRKQWNGLIVRERSWEARHPQDFVRGIADYQNVPEARPRPRDRFVSVPILLTESGLPGDVGYGPPYTTEGPNGGGGPLYSEGGPFNGELAPIDPADYPKSA